jgi:lathosterol oxidase
MDIILEFLDPLVLDKTYTWTLSYLSTSYNSSSDVDVSANPNQASTSMWTRDSIYRQCVSIFLITQFGACFLYFFFSSLSYYFVFDRRLEYHPRFLKNQVRQEIHSALAAIPVINILTLPWFLAEIRGYSLLYMDVSSYGWTWLAISALLYISFNDFAIYWIHRLEHHPSIYKYIHKPHHKWIGILLTYLLQERC